MTAITVTWCKPSYTNSRINNTELLKNKNFIQYHCHPHSLLSNYVPPHVLPLSLCKHSNYCTYAVQTLLKLKNLV